MKAIADRSAVIAGAILVSLVILTAQTSIAETLLSPFQSQKLDSGQVQTEGKVESEADSTTEETPVVPPRQYVATAYSLRGRTASGRMVGKGLIAADPRVLPLGSRVRVDAGGYSGEYLVADTGGLIRGRRIDIWIASTREAMRFGRRKVKLTVLSFPAKRSRRPARS